MTQSRTALVVLLVIATAVMSFVITRTQGSASQTHAEDWLENAAPDVVEADREFQEKNRTLTDQAKQEQAALAALLCRTEAGGDEIRERSEAVLGLHAAVMRQVGEHLVSLGSRLSPERRDMLMQVTAEVLSEHIERRYQHRRGMQESGGRHEGQGGMGRRAGGSQGQQHQRGREGVDNGAGRQEGGESAGNMFCRRMGMTAEQVEQSAALDPGFDADAQTLRMHLMAEHQKLADLFESDTGGTEILDQIDALIEAHNQLERRLTEHVLLIRPILRPGQRQRMMEMCSGQGSRGGRGQN